MNGYRKFKFGHSVEYDVLLGARKINSFATIPKKYLMQSIVKNVLVLQVIRYHYLQTRESK